MMTIDDAKLQGKGIAIARAQFCWETEANSGRVLHYYGSPDGKLRSHPSMQECEGCISHNNNS